MVNASLISRLSHAVDLIEQRSQQNRPWRVAQIRRDIGEDPDVARERHYAVHPEDRDADVVIWNFFDDEGTAEQSRDCGPPAGPAHKQP